MEQNQNRIAPEVSANESISPRNAHDKPASGIAFDPVPVRERIDGITPAKQREFVEALADTGLVNVAAARIGVSEQCIARLRRRADARSFDLACHAARRIGARRLHALAWERAIEGTIKRHHYHGELVSEERVFDNRLLVYLLGKTAHLLDEPEEAGAVVRNWEPFVEAMEQGLPAPKLADAEADEDNLDEEDEETGEFDGSEVWEEFAGEWWTDFPPPAGFDGCYEGDPGRYGYKRRLTDAEQRVAEAEEREEVGEELAEQCARRDRYFGFTGGLSEELKAEGFFFPMEAEPSEYSERSAEARRAAEQRAGGQGPRERPADAGAREHSEAAPRSRSDANGRPACGGADRTDVTDNGP